MPGSFSGSSQALSIKDRIRGCATEKRGDINSNASSAGHDSLIGEGQGKVQDPGVLDFGFCTVTRF